jgi:hypothetical protein
MRKNPRRILSPQRLPFRHPGNGQKIKLLFHSHRLANRPRCCCGAIGSLELRFHPRDRVLREVRREM